jgi:hypothetical protein
MTALPKCLIRRPVVGRNLIQRPADRTEHPVELLSADRPPAVLRAVCSCFAACSIDLHDS